MAHDLGLACPRCARLHPTIDGIPIVLADLDEWLRSEGPSLLCRTDLPDPLTLRLMQASGGCLARDAQLAAAYAGRPPSGLDAFVADVLQDAPGPVLDVGCGMGVHTRRDVVGIDLNWTMLRQFPGRRVLGDAIAPPFHAGSFGTVLLLNVVDSCRDPEVLVQQAVALLRPGGRLVLTCAFAWAEHNTPRHRQLDEGQLDALLAALGLDPTPGETTWILPRGPRAESHYRLATRVAEVGR